MKRIVFLLGVAFLFSIPQVSSGQFLKKLKEKANNAVNKVVDNKPPVPLKVALLLILRVKLPAAVVNP